MSCKRRPRRRPRDRFRLTLERLERSGVRYLYERPEDARERWIARVTCLGANWSMSGGSSESIATARDDGRRVLSRLREHIERGAAYRAAYRAADKLERAPWSPWHGFATRADVNAHFEREQDERP